MAILVSDFFLKLPNQEPKDPLDWIVLDIIMRFNKIYICRNIVIKDISYFSCLSCY